MTDTAITCSGSADYTASVIMLLFGIIKKNALQTPTSRRCHEQKKLMTHCSGYVNYNDVYIYNNLSRYPLFLPGNALDGIFLFAQVDLLCANNLFLCTTPGWS